MAESIITFEDALEHVIDTMGLSRDDRTERLARRAVMLAYRQVPLRHRWSYYKRIGQILTVASDDGTVTYDHTGGASERLATVASITIPNVADVGLYKLMIGNQVYDIDERKSATTCTLTAATNPGADVAAGTSATLFKSKYNLLDGFRAMYSDVIDLPRGYGLGYFEPQDLLNLQAGNYQPQEPRGYTIHNAGEGYGKTVIELAPPPNQARVWSYACEVGARAFTLKADREQSTASITVTTDGTTTVAGTGTSWTSKLVGCILRVAASGTTAPSGLAAGLDTSLPVYEHQRTITAVASTTSLTVDTAIATLSGVGYSISDPIDIDPEIMTEWFLAECEARYAGLDRDHSQVKGEKRMEAESELLKAQIADNRKKDFTDGPGNRLRWPVDMAIPGSSGMTLLD